MTLKAPSLFTFLFFFFLRALDSLCDFSDGVWWPFVYLLKVYSDCSTLCYEFPLV